MSSGELCSQLRATFERYLRVGQALRNIGDCATLQEFVSDLQSHKACPRPFGVVDGPSGIGKTQQFFALRDVKVIYIPVTNWAVSAEANQDIYRVFQGVTQAFTGALAADMATDFSAVMEHTGHNDYVFTVDSISKMQTWGWKLWTPGVILALLQRLQDVDDDSVLQTLAGVCSSDTVNVVDASIDDLCRYVRALPNNNFVFVLDEVPGSKGGDSSGDNLKNFTFCRNLLRACGLTVIFAGTGSTVLNHMAGPSATDTPRLFCKVVTKVAAPTMVTLAAAFDKQDIKRELESLNVPGLSDLIITARPRLAYWLAQAAFAGVDDGLDGMLDRVAARMFQHKLQLRAGDGQWASFQQQGQYVEGDAVILRDRVVHHMANVFITFQGDKQPLRTADFYATQRGMRLGVAEPTKVGDLTYFTASFLSYFPTAAEEPLLYMLLHGGRTLQSRPFGADHRISVVTERLGRDIRPTIDDRGSARCRDGDKLEAIVTVALCVASCSSGLCGTLAGTFLTRVCSELSLHRTDAAWAELDCAGGLMWDDVLGEISDHVHPYLFHPAPVPKGEAPSWSVPNFVCAADRRIGQIYRCLDSEEHDVNVILPPDGVDCAPNVFRVTAECKNRDKKLQTTYLVNNCIKKIPSDSHVHLVVCDTIGRDLFKGDVGSRVMFDVNKVVPGGASAVTGKRIRVLKATRVNTQLKVEYVSASHQAAWGEEQNKADHIVLVLSIFSLAAEGCQSDVSGFLSS